MEIGREGEGEGIDKRRKEERREDAIAVSVSKNMRHA